MKNFLRHGPAVNSYQLTDEATEFSQALTGAEASDWLRSMFNQQGVRRLLNQAVSGRPVRVYGRSVRLEVA